MFESYQAFLDEISDFAVTTTELNLAVSEDRALTVDERETVRENVDYIADATHLRDAYDAGAFTKRGAFLCDECGEIHDGLPEDMTDREVVSAVAARLGRIAGLLQSGMPIELAMMLTAGRPL